MFGKIVAISTVKHLSRNYAFFSNQVCMSGIAYPLLIGLKASWNHYPSTADFHGDGCFLQNAGFTKGLRIASVVCDVNSETKVIQVNSTNFEVFLPYTLSIANSLFLTLPTNALFHRVTAVSLPYIHLPQATSNMPYTVGGLLHR